MRRYAKIDIFVCFTVLALKYGVVLPSLITNDFYPQYKFTSKSIFFKLNKKWFFIKSSAFSISAVIKKPSISKELVISRIPDTTLHHHF